VTLAIARDNNNGALELRHNGTAMDTTNDGFARLALWAEAAQAAHSMATSLVQTSFVPEAFRGKAHEATAAILAGAEVGLDPMASLRSFDIIQGTAAPRANTLRAIVQSKGHQIRVVESTATRAVVEGRRRGEQDWQRSVWTIERAQKMGLTGKKNWQAQPAAMLVARATAEVSRWIASDAIAGIAYSAEELADDGAVYEPASVDAPAAEVKPARKTAQRRPVAPPPPVADLEPELDEPEPVVSEPVSAPPADADGITKPQMGKMQALFKQKGIDDRAQRLAYVAESIGREVASSNELSKREASQVIDDLSQLPDMPENDWPQATEPGGAE